MRFATNIKPEYIEAVSNELLKRARGLLAYPIDTASVRVSTDFQEYWNDNVNYNLEIPKEIKEMLNLYEGKERDNIYDAFIQDKYIEELINGAREIKRKIYVENIGKKDRKEIKKEIRQAVKKYMEENAGLLLERYKEELKRKAGDELKNKIDEYFCANDLKDYYEKLSHIKFVSIDSTLEDPSKGVEDYLHSLLKEEAAADYLTRKGLYFISGDGELKRAKNYKEIFHKLSKQERKKVKEYEKKLGLRKSKAFAIGAASIILGAIGAAAYHAYKSGEKLKGDSSYFFHNPNDYIKYLKSIWNKHSNDIDNDRIPNDVEEKYGLNMFYAGDAGEDWDNDGLSNYDELIRYAALFGILDIHSKDSDGDGYNDSYEVKVPGLHPKNPDVDNDGLLDGKNEDGDPFTNWFERNKMMTDPEVPNDLYVLAVSCLSNISWYYKPFNLDPEKTIILWLENGEYPTFSDFLRAVNKLSKEVSENDILLVNLQAHGSPVSILFEDGWVSYEDIGQALNKLKCERMVIITDACYSGGAINYLKEINSANELAILTSVAANETGGGVDRESLKCMCGDAGKEFDINNDSFFSLYEGFNYWKYIQKTHPKGGKHPQLYERPENLTKHFYLKEWIWIDEKMVEPNKF